MLATGVRGGGEEGSVEGEPGLEPRADFESSSAREVLSSFGELSEALELRTPNSDCDEIELSRRI